MKESNQFELPKLECQMLQSFNIPQFKQFICPYTPASYLGTYFFYEGNRIKLVQSNPTSQNHNLQRPKPFIVDKKLNKSKSPPQIIIFSKDGKTVFIITDSKGKPRPSKDQFNNKQIYVNQYFLNWKGYRYIKNQQIYYGDFNQFDRQGYGVQIKIQKVNQDTPLSKQLLNSKNTHVITIYSGNFLSNQRNSDEKAAKLQYFSFNNLEPLMETSGYFINGHQQGIHTLLYKKTRQQAIVNYLNGCIISKNSDKSLLNKKLTEPFQTYNSHFSISYTNKTMKSLTEKQWLNPEVLDYFFRRIQFSHQCQHHRYTDYKKPNVKFLSTTFFQKLVPSQVVSKLNYRINYQNVKYLFSPFQTLVSFFQIYELVVFPLNRDTHHFCLGAIKSKIKRSSQGELESVYFQIYNLDSIYEDQVVSSRIIQLLQVSISKLSITEKKIFQQGIDKAKKQVRTVKQLGASIQKNSYDCGVYVCMYGYLLYKSVNQPNQTNWKFSQTLMIKMRIFLLNCLKYKFGDFMIRLNQIMSIKKPVIVKKE